MRQETAKLLRLALPILITQLAYMATAATDTIMAGRLGPTALAAVGLGSAMWVPMTTFIGGTLYIMLPAIAGQIAARRHAHAGREAVHGAWLGLLLGGTGGLALWTVAPAGLALAGLAPEVLDPAVSYLGGVALGLPFLGLWTAARFFCDGHSDTRPAMLTALCTAVLNVPLNALFMFGLDLGVAGTGISSGIGMAIGAGLMSWRALAAKRYARARLRQAPRALNLRGVAAMLRRGAPVGLMFLSEYAALSAVAVLVGRLGSLPLAAHQVAFNLTMTLFMFPASLAVAVSIRVGAAMGVADEEGARTSLAACLLLACGMSTGLALALLAVPEVVAKWYTPDPTVQALAAHLFVMAAGFLVFAAAQAVIAGYLRGLGDARGPMALTQAAYWLVGMPVGWGLADVYGVAGWWGGLLCAIITLAALMTLRVSRGWGRTGNADK